MEGKRILQTSVTREAYLFRTQMFHVIPRVQTSFRRPLDLLPRHPTVCSLRPGSEEPIRRADVVSMLACRKRGGELQVLHLQTDFSCHGCSFSSSAGTCSGTSLQSQCTGRKVAADLQTGVMIQRTPVEKHIILAWLENLPLLAIGANGARLMIKRRRPGV